MCVCLYMPESPWGSVPCRWCCVHVPCMHAGSTGCSVHARIRRCMHIWYMHADSTACIGCTFGCTHADSSVCMFRFVEAGRAVCRFDCASTHRDSRRTCRRAQWMCTGSAVCMCVHVGVPAWAQAEVGACCWDMGLSVLLHAGAAKVLVVPRALCMGITGPWGCCACSDSSTAFLVHPELPAAVGPSLT